MVKLTLRRVLVLHYPIVLVGTTLAVCIAGLLH
jgi:hypothetical protein